MSDDEEPEDGGASWVSTGGMQLGNISATFDGPELTPPQKRARFHAAIERLKASLDSYEPLASVFDLDDDRLIDASGDLHQALLQVRIEHVRVAGGPFPLTREYREPSWDRYDAPEAEPDPDNEPYEQIPPMEFGATVPLDIELEATDGAHRVRGLLAFSSGVILTIDSYLVRGGEEWRSWQEHAQAFMEFDHDHMPLLVGGRSVDSHGGSASNDGRVVRRVQDYWLRGPFLGDELECEYRVTDDERAPFALDARVIREAQRRARPI